MNVQLIHHLLPMLLYGFNANAQLICRLLVGKAFRDELQDLINRGVGVVAGAGLSRPGTPRPVAGR